MMRDEEVINNILNKGICPDNYVGYYKGDNISELHILKERRNNYKYRKISDALNSISDNQISNNRIVLVLESPGINEYNDDIMPAVGRTGKRINKYSVNVLKARGINEGHIFIVNAVQYQCNNGENKNVNLKKRMFTYFWKNYNTLSERIAEINPTHIINASGYFCRKRVDSVINNFENVEIFSVYHPSVWNDKTSLTKVQK